MVLNSTLDLNEESQLVHELQLKPGGMLQVYIVGTSLEATELSAENLPGDFTIPIHSKWLDLESELIGYAW